MSGYKMFDKLTMKYSIFRLQTALKKQYQKTYGENHLDIEFQICVPLSSSLDLIKWAI